MNKKQNMVNVCGIPESEWNNGFCKACGKICDMSDAEMIEKRAFDYASKRFVFYGGKFSAEEIRRQLDEINKVFKLPKYFREAISCDGQKFGELEDFPAGIPMRACRDGKDGTLTVGMICWREVLNDESHEELCICKSGIHLDAESCRKAFDGAMFEPASFGIDYYR